jgi:hypothetical protein
MNDEDSTSGSSTPTQDSVTYTHTIQFSDSLEPMNQPTVIIEWKSDVPKLKGILPNHHMTIPTVSPFDVWCDGGVARDIE